MNDKPTVTKKFPIEVPTHKYYSNFAVYKVWFGKYFFIWKGKSLLQSAESLAVLVDRVRRNGADSTNNLYHVAAYIRRARVIRGYLEIVEIADFDDHEWLKYLQVEQNLLTAHRNDPYCLNNNFTAHVPEWMGQEVKVVFEKWLKDRKKGRKPAIKNS